MEIKEIKAEYRMQEMQKAIQSRMESGLTISEWCQQNHFSEGSYYYWLKKIRNNAIEAMNSENEIVQVPVTLQTTPAKKAEPITLKYKKMELEIPSGTEISDILAVLRAVQSC